MRVIFGKGELYHLQQLNCKRQLAKNNMNFMFVSKKTRSAAITSLFMVADGREHDHNRNKQLLCAEK